MRGRFTFQTLSNETYDGNQLEEEQRHGFGCEIYLHTSTNKVCNSLNLGYNSIGDEGAIAVAEL